MSIVLVPGAELEITDYASMCAFWKNFDPSDSMAVERYLFHPTIRSIFDQIDKLDDVDRSSMSLVPYSPIGYVYAAWNPLFGGLIKIGATKRHNPYLRVVELSTAGVPEPFQLIASIPTADPFALERDIHRHFETVRKYGKKKEFFMLSREDIVDYFHFRSISMCRNLSVRSDSKMKKEGEDKQRKHRPVYDTTDQFEEFEEKVRNFVQNKLSVAASNFVMRQKVICEFEKFQNKEIRSKTLFFRCLYKSINLKFPGATTHSRGYRGIQINPV